jgi:TPP-dependent pyruvate/acetoin dehydrogenase alpha subunit
MDNEAALELYKLMYTIRLFEEKAIELYKRNLIGGSLHVYIGEEAIAVGVCSALKADDALVSTHRGHGHCIAKGACLEGMFAELLGKVDGLCKGKGGSMHIADMRKGILGANGIVGGGISLSTGIALGFKFKQRQQVSICFFGDGAINQGVLYESLNLAVIWKLPVIFVCENNQYALSSRVDCMTGGQGIEQRALAFGVMAESVDGNCVEEVYQATCRAVDRARAGEGPSLINANTYRWYGHFYGDPCVYRTEAEVESWKERCPISTYRDLLCVRTKGFAERLKSIETEVSIAVDRAAEFALNCAAPEPEMVLEDIYES